MAKKIFFENVPLNKTIPNLLELLDPIATVQWVFMLSDPKTQKFNGQVYVELWSDTEAEIVIDKWHNQPLDNNTLQIKLVEDNEMSPEKKEDKTDILTAEASYIYSVIRFQVNAPPGAVVFVNDFPKAQVDEMGNGVVRSLLPGKYNIKVGFQEYLLAEEDVSVNCDEEPPRLKVSMDASFTQAMGAVSSEGLEGAYSTIEMISAGSGPVTVTTKATPLMPLSINTTTTKATKLTPAAGNAAQFSTLFVEKATDTGGKVEVVGSKAKGSNNKLFIAIAIVVVIVGGIVAIKFTAKPTTGNNTETPIVKEAPPPPAPQGMVYIPGGVVIIGRNNTKDEYQKPVHEVLIPKGYYIDKTEVTNEDYWQYVQDVKKTAPKSWGGDKPASDMMLLPVVTVAWNDAAAYCQWRGTRKGLLTRLPTEFEWEHAARGEKNYVYPWGNDWLPGYANADNVNRKIMPVGSNPKDVSPYGLFDMAGNVREWTKSDFSLYEGSKGKPERDVKAARGGAYSDPADFANNTFRGWLDPNKDTFDRTGFRCVCELPETKDSK